MSGNNCFFDTNVLLYLFSQNENKADRVEQLLSQHGVISVQVLNEFTTASRRKLKLSFSECREILDTIRAVCDTQALTIETHDQGIQVSERYGFSIYDSMIVASALLADCKTLYSEDLQHGQVIDDQLTVTNPFLDA
jgi:predicted nucleic acid-binding protein